MERYSRKRDIHEIEPGMVADCAGVGLERSRDDRGILCISLVLPPAVGEDAGMNSASGGVLVRQLQPFTPGMPSQFS